MNEKDLLKLAQLTDRNNHGEAREFIASKFTYCKGFAKRFHLLNELHSLDGALDFSLMSYRQKVTHAMLEEIYYHNGQKVADKINACL